MQEEEGGEGGGGDIRYSALTASSELTDSGGRRIDGSQGRL